MSARILLTGAAGRAASGIRALLRDRGHELILQDQRAPDENPQAGEHLVLGDLGDDAVLAAAFESRIDLVVHLGGHSGERPLTEIVDANIIGTQRVLEAARRGGVERALLASSTHVAGFWPTEAGLDPELPPRPDSFYGVGKVAVEALGSVYADRFGMIVVAARIGTIEARPRNLRSLSTWLSFGDFVRLIEATLSTNASGFHHVWAVSANTRSWFPTSSGSPIGFVPLDDAEVFASTIDATAPALSDALIGGAFADLARPLGGTW